VQECYIWNLPSFLFHRCLYVNTVVYRLSTIQSLLRANERTPLLGVLSAVIAVCGVVVRQKGEVWCGVLLLVLRTTLSDDQTEMASLSPSALSLFGIN